MAKTRDIQDRWTPSISGFLILGVIIAAAIWGLINYRAAIDLYFQFPPLVILAGIFFFIFIVPGFVIIRPNKSLVLLFAGSYLGTVNSTGFYWIIPFTSRQRVSRRVVNFNTNTTKVNDKTGNPIEIAAVIVWRVKDSARAVLNVTDYRDFVSVQGETAVRSLASRFPYDSEEGEESLRGSPEQISNDLQNELAQRLEIAGVEVLEARLSHLAYAPEIAVAMLRKQQAEAVVRARRIITANAVDIVEQAIKTLETGGIVELNADERSRLVNNLLVALVADTGAQPVLDLGP